MKAHAFEAEFSRVSLLNISRDAPPPMGWCVISYRWIPKKSDRRKLHGKWYVIRSEYATIYRVLRFSPGLKGKTADAKGQIALDWPGWIELTDYADDVEIPLNLAFRRLPWHLQLRAALKHPDPAYRLGAWLASWSIVLALFSILLAVLLT